MKKIFEISLIFTALFFVSCSFEIPSSVSVKTKASYSFATGNVEKSFNDSFDKSKLFSGLETANNKVYDYNPALKSENCQKFLLEINILEIDLKTLAGGVAPLPNVSIPLTSYKSTPPKNTINIKIKDIFDALDVLGTDFKNKSEFSSIPVYLYCNKPTGFSDIEFKGFVKFLNNDETKNFTMGNTGTVIPFSSKPDIIKKENTVITDLGLKAYSLKDDMAEFINDNKGSDQELKIDYEFTISGKTNGEPISNIEIVAYIELPFSFKAKDKIDVDLVTLQGKTTSDDLFGRDKATDTGDIKKFLDAIKTVNLEFTTVQSPFVSDRILTYNFVNASPKKPELDLNLNYLHDTVTLNNSQLTELLENHPQSPSMTLNLPKDSTFTIPRDVRLEMKVNIKTDTDGVIKF